MAKKHLFWTITSLLILIAAYVITATVIIPVVSSNPLPEAKTVRAEEKKENNAKKSDKKVPKVEVVEKESLSPGKDDLLSLFELRKSEMILRARYSLSSEDSIYLVLDLIDMVASLEMKGVPLHQCKIVNLFVSNSIQKFHTETLIRWLAQPFVLKNAVSTIARVPFVEKNAPKDTIEANKSEALPVAPKLDDVYIVMNFERNLQLIIQQEEKSEGPEKLRLDSLKWSFKKKEINQTIKSLTTFKRDAVIPKIAITLKKLDATVLFRALPYKSKMVIRM